MIVLFQSFPFQFPLKLCSYWRLGKINHVLFYLFHFVLHRYFLFQFLVLSTIWVVCRRIQILPQQNVFAKIEVINGFCFIFLFLSLQYRAAISSVHSTPSKSFILNSSSPNSTLLSNQSMSPKHNNSSIQSPQNNSQNNSHNNSVNNFQSNFAQSPQSNQQHLSSPVHTSNQIHNNKNNNQSSPSHQPQQQNLPPHAYALQQKQRSFLTFGFSAGGSGPSRRESHVNVNVTPTSHDITSDTPEIRKYKKRFNSEILCAALWGVNLLIGTENGLMLLDRSGQGKVHHQSPPIISIS